MSQPRRRSSVSRIPSSPSAASGGTRRRPRIARRALRLESLETRDLMAVATQVDHTFRSDDFSLNGTFTYQLSSPANQNFLDQINNGSYTGSNGHVDWTSPTAGTGYFEGVATGTGRTSVVAAGARRTCADYTIRDEGRLDFTLDAAASDMLVTQANATSTTYTSYQDRTGGQCPAPANPWSRFFGGNPTLYDGTFSSNTHAVSVKYTQTGDNTMTVTSPAATIQWANGTATDLVVNGAAYYAPPVAPSGWVALAQTATVKPVTTIDPESGGVTVDASVVGKTLKTSTPNTPVANVRLFWASTSTDTTGGEITVTSNSQPVGLYWNSATSTARIEQLPTPPAGANFLRVVVSGPTGGDSNAANSSVFLPLDLFEVGTRSFGPIAAGATFDGSSASLLTTTDLANPDIRVFAYNPVSTLGGDVVVSSDAGGFTYDPTDAPGVRALAAGELGQDSLPFLAIKNQKVLDAAAALITVIGVNDPPVATNDAAATTNAAKLTVAASTLAANDSDPDHGDHVRVSQIATTSSRGALVRLFRDGITGAITSLEYDPSSSAQLLGLSPGAQLVDQISYEIRDVLGLTAQGVLSVTVTGAAAALRIGGMADQRMRAGETLGPLSITLADPDGDASDLQVVAVSSNGVVIPSESLAVTGSGASRSLVITSLAGVSGKTTITIQATDGAAKNASTSFALVVGTTTDLDLDGIDDSVEDAAPHGGDQNQDGLPDSQQSYVVSAVAASGDYFQLLAVQPAAFENVAVRNGLADPAAPNDMSLPLGVTHVELVLASGTTGTIALRSDDAPEVVNRLLQIKPAGQWSGAMRKQNQGALLDSSGVLTVMLLDGGWLDSTSAGDRRIAFDAGLAHANHPWRNDDNLLDITNDGTIAPVDALSIINELNGLGPRPLPSVPTGVMTIPVFLDANGDNFVSPVDALTVINYLNAQTAGEGEGGADALAPSASSGLAPLPPEASEPRRRVAALAAVLAERVESAVESLVCVADDAEDSPTP